MATYQVTYFFNLSKWGWTETYYADGTGPDAVMVRAKALIATRTALMARPARIEAIRVSDVNILNDSLVFFQAIGGDGAVGQPTTPDVPWTSWLTKATSLNGRNRNIYLRGVPDSTVEFDQNANFNNAPANFRQAFNNWVNVLLQQSFAIRYRVDGGLGNPVLPINAVAGTADGYFVINVVGHTYTANQKVIIRGMRGSGTECLNGIQTIRAIQPGNAIVLFRRSPATEYPGYTGAGKIALLQYSYSTFQGLQLLRPVKRSTGRPFFGTRGRRSANKCCPSTPAG